MKMPLYEGIGLIHENPPIVMDIGTVYTKIGFAGETGPSCFRIIPTEVMCTRTRTVRRVSSYTSESDLYSLLADLVHTIHFKHLLVNPRDRRIVVVDSILSNSLLRKTLTKVLLGQYEATSVLFLPSHIAAVFTLGIPSGLVLDVGYTEASVVPVYECFPVLGAWQALPRASQAMHRNLKQLLIQDGKVWQDVEASHTLQLQEDDLPEKVLEDIKVRACFVTNFERSQKLASEAEDPPSPPQGTLYPLGGVKTLYIPGEVREKMSECMFEPDIDHMSMASMILDAIIKSPIDMRTTLAENLVVIGGTAMMPGFHHRLMAEINSLVKHPRYQHKLAVKKFKIHKTPVKENYTAWLGGAILGATDLVMTKSLTKEQYAKDRIVPEWCDLRTNSPSYSPDAGFSSRHLL